MKTVLLPLFICLSVPALLPAQETIPADRAQHGARIANQALGKLEGAQVAVEPDLDHPQGLGGDGVGVLVVPDRAFTVDKIASLGDQPLPLAQLWMLNVAVAQGGTAPVREKLRFLDVQDDSNSFHVQLYLLGVAKNAEGKPELVVYGKDAEPLVHAPLAAANVNFPSLPIELSVAREGTDSGKLTLSIAGQHSADLQVVKFGE
jgi:hypothetical protein